MEEMTPHLKQDQIIQLAMTLSTNFNNKEVISCKQAVNPKKHNQFLIDEFIKSKQVEGRSQRTLDIYKRTLDMISDFLKKRDKLLEDMTTQDFREFLQYKMDAGSNNTTCDNLRRNASSFYAWAMNEHYTTFNPIVAIAPVKRARRKHKSFTDKELLKIREACNCLRDRAMIELFISSGIRVGEMTNILIEDVDLENYEFNVIGKGDKERTCYFNEITKVYIQRYLEERGEDTSPYLWKSKRSDRFGIHGIERMVRETGKRAGVKKVHPHRFRHTFATNALSKGIPVEQVQVLLGHEKLDTTTIYAQVSRDDVKYNHHKLMN